MWRSTYSVMLTTGPPPVLQQVQYVQRSCMASQIFPVLSLAEDFSFSFSQKTKQKKQKHSI